MTEISDNRMIFLLFYAAMLTAIHDSVAIFVAKALNSAVAQSLTPTFACQSNPAADWVNVYRQFVVCVIISIVVFPVYLRSSVKGGQFQATLKYMFGAILGWSYKELSQIFVGVVAKGIQKTGTHGDNRLLNYLQSDASFKKEQAWVLVASYASFVGICGILTYIIFVPALPLINEFFWKLTSLAARIKFIQETKKETSEDASENQENNEEGEINQDSQHEEDKISSESLHRERSDALAFDFVNQSIRISYAWIMNGMVSGILVVLFTDSYGETNVKVVSSFGLLEVYCILVLVVAGSIYGSQSEEEAQKTPTKIQKFYKMWWATWAGFGIASLGVSPGGISALIENSPIPDQVANLLRALFSIIFATILLLISSKVRVKRKVFTFDVTDRTGTEIANFMTTASIFSMAVSWEEFCGDLACSFAGDDDDASDKALSALAVMWIYCLVAFVLFPLSLPFGRRGGSEKEIAEKKLIAFFEQQNMNAI